MQCITSKNHTNGAYDRQHKWEAFSREREHHEYYIPPKNTRFHISNRQSDRIPCSHSHRIRTQPQHLESRTKLNPRGMAMDGTKRRRRDRKVDETRGGGMMHLGGLDGFHEGSQLASPPLRLAAAVDLHFSLTLGARWLPASSPHPNSSLRYT